MVSVICALAYRLYFETSANLFVLGILGFFAVAFGIGGCLIKYRNFIQLEEGEFLITINGETKSIPLKDLEGEIVKEGTPVAHNVLRVKVDENWILFKGFKVDHLLDFLQQSGAASKIINKT
tara:strand:- start:36 stop:401 length:366 start_codon:yes stop_codon:yes gene_type:complete